MKENVKWNCKVSETIKLLNIKLVGYYRYYGITDNTNSIRSFYEITVKMYYKILNRRSQKNKYSYKEYYEKIQKHKHTATERSTIGENCITKCGAFSVLSVLI